MSDIHNDGTPFPNPSSAPLHVTETADTTNPRLMILSAVIPVFIVSPLDVNRLMSHPGAIRHNSIPTIIITSVITSAVINMLLTLFFSPAP